MAPGSRCFRHLRSLEAALAALSFAAMLAIPALHLPLAVADEPPVPDNAPPAAVTGLLAQDARDGRVLLVWNASPEGDLDHYAIYYGEDSFLTVHGRTPQARLEDPGVTSYTVSGLRDGVRYFFAVTAVDLDGNENKTVLSLPATPTASSPADTIPPPRVGGLSARDARDGRVELAWTPVDAPDIDHYSVYVALRAGTAVADLAPVVNVTGGPAGSALVTGLEDHRTYYFAVTSVDRSGNEDRTVLATVPATPTPSAPGRRSSPDGTAGMLYDTVIGLLIVSLVAIATYLALDRADGPPGDRGRGKRAGRTDGPGSTPEGRGHEGGGGS